MIGSAQLEPRGRINSNVYGADPAQTPVDLSGIDNVLDFRDISALVLFLSGN